MKLEWAAEVADREITEEPQEAESTVQDQNVQSKDSDSWLSHSGRLYPETSTLTAELLGILFLSNI